MIDLAAINLGATLPALTLAFGACLLLLLDLWVPKDRKQITARLALLGAALAFVISVLDLRRSETAFYGMMIVDSFTAIINMIALITAFLSVLAAQDYLKRTGIERGEYYPLLLLSASGAMMMGAAGDLAVVFVGLELLSIPLYIMAGFRRNDLRSEESAMKYFLLGAFATGFLVYGIALVYGATGTTNLRAIFSRVGAAELSSSYLLLMGAGLILVGLGFKVAAVPFHMWTPDVYQGAPTPVTAYMSVAAKVGGFAALLRVLAIAIPTFVLVDPNIAPGQTALARTAWQDTVALIAGATMLLGNFVAIVQRDIKRLLAYSSIAHAGYILMAVAATGTFQVTVGADGSRTLGLTIAQEAIQGALIYLFAYAFTNIGAFSVAIAVEKNDGTGTNVDDLAGLGRLRPGLAGAMTIFMLSLIGIPLTGGFIGKWLVFRSSLNANLALLAVIGVLTSLISAYYYLRVIVKVWLEPGEADAKPGFSLSSAVLVCAIGTVAIGILPTVVNLAQTVTTMTAVALK